jgi:hypothetical protein
MKTGGNPIPIAGRKFRGGGGFAPPIGLLWTHYFAFGANR